VSVRGARMKTIFVTANDTGVGKTYVTAVLARKLLALGHSVEVLKCVETGVTAGAFGDAERVAACLLSCNVSLDRWNTRTFFRFSEPLVPVEAAGRAGIQLNFDTLVDAACCDSEWDWRIIEGAGGIAVPLENAACPRDWADFASAIKADHVVVVIENRLGAINQARLVAAYARSRQLKWAWWLNRARAAECSEGLLASNEQALHSLGSPLWGKTEYGDPIGTFVEPEWSV